MAAKSERLEMFHEYLRWSGVVVEGFEDQDIARVHAWLSGIVTLDPGTDLAAAAVEIPDFSTPPLVLDAMSRSLAWDFGLFLGESIIHRHPSLGWELGTGSRKTVNFQRPAVGHCTYENGYVEQWPVMWTAQGELEGAAIGRAGLDSLLRFVNFWPGESR
ncbi:hypothetical protein [Cellulomonas hominis]